MSKQNQEELQNKKKTGEYSVLLNRWLDACKDKESLISRRTFFKLSLVRLDLYCIVQILIHHSSCQHVFFR